MAAGLSVQLYTLRKEAKAQCLGPVIDRLGKIGYAGVEPAGFGELTPEAFKKRVADAGMVVSSAHVALPDPNKASEVLDQQAAIGNDMIVVPFLPPDDFKDESAVKRSADKLNAFNVAVKARGARLGYHNHWWEFGTKVVGGQSAHARFFELLDPSVFAEIDIYWAKVGGANPTDVVNSMGDRARLLHIKDGPADGHESPMVAVGDGVVDIAGVAKASKAKWHIVELDQCATDMFAAVEKSHRFMTKGGYAAGQKK
jgi:sugar phosphate isomerase/epimerase